jgi:hypothetical protein
MLQLHDANYNFNLSPGFWTTNAEILLHQLHWCYVGWAVGKAAPGRPAFMTPAGPQPALAFAECPPLVQIRVKNTCGHPCVKLGMAAIEKLDRLRAGKARIAERRAS